MTDHKKCQHCSKCDGTKYSHANIIELKLEFYIILFHLPLQFAIVQNNILFKSND